MNLNLRKFENYHIVLWLVKDLFWASEWKYMGVAMIAPTVGLAIYITRLSIGDKFEFLHNVAICFWISANATWMTGEFFDFEGIAKTIAVVLFIIGLSIIAYSYPQRRKLRKQSQA